MQEVTVELEYEVEGEVEAHVVTYRPKEAKDAISMQA